MSGVVVWLTGLPGSGKTTLARRLRERLAAPSVILDSDEIREALGEDGYGPDQREAFYRHLAALAALLARQDLVVLVPATANLRAFRTHARQVAPRFVEVWVNTPIDETRRRDPKGLYARARAGDAPKLPGAGDAYEEPDEPEVVARGGLDDDAIGEVVRLLSS